MDQEWRQSQEDFKQGKDHTDSRIRIPGEQREIVGVCKTGRICETERPYEDDGNVGNVYVDSDIVKYFCT